MFAYVRLYLFFMIIVSKYACIHFFILTGVLCYVMYVCIYIYIYIYISISISVDRARMAAACFPHSGDWLTALPITSCGLCIDNEGVRAAVGLRLGLDLCSPHMCQCG